MSSSLFKDEKRTQYSPLMTREEQVRDRDDGRRATMGRRETIWLDDADETTARRRRRTKAKDARGREGAMRWIRANRGWRRDRRANGGAWVPATRRNARRSECASARAQCGNARLTNEIDTNARARTVGGGG